VSFLTSSRPDAIRRPTPGQESLRRRWRPGAWAARLPGRQVRDLPVSGPCDAPPSGVRRAAYTGRPSRPPREPTPAVSRPPGAAATLGQVLSPTSLVDSARLGRRQAASARQVWSTDGVVNGRSGRGGVARARAPGRRFVGGASNTRGPSTSSCHERAPLASVVGGARNGTALDGGHARRRERPAPVRLDGRRRRTSGRPAGPRSPGRSAPSAAYRARRPGPGGPMKRDAPAPGTIPGAGAASLSVAVRAESPYSLTPAAFCLRSSMALACIASASLSRACWRAAFFSMPACTRSSRPRYVMASM
jgi:hypothetical protein